jgi:predicted ArsR family transcriptional regulator
MQRPAVSFRRFARRAPDAFMSPIGIHRDLFESSRGRIIAILRRGQRTVDEIAAELKVSGNAVRAQLSAMERDGLVRQGGMHRGATRPSRTYELTTELEHRLSRANVPFLTHLVRLVASSETPTRFDRLMRDAGRGVARELAPRFPTGTFSARVSAASHVLNEELGATTEVTRTDGMHVIRGRGCPLAALTGKHPGVCHAIESLLAELLEAKVHECCDRSNQPRCCFEISPGSPRRPYGRSAIVG